MSFRLLYNKILTSTPVIIECVSWLINVTDSGITLVKMDECAKGFTDSYETFKFHNFVINFELKHLNK